MSERPAFVYFARVAPQTYKIGRTVDLDKRMRRLQRHRDLTVTLAAVIPSTREWYNTLEWQIHRRLSGWRLCGSCEWFVVEDDVLDALLMEFGGYREVGE